METDSGIEYCVQHKRHKEKKGIENECWDGNAITMDITKEHGLQ
jgi:hypothetical protein